MSHPVRVRGLKHIQGIRFRVRFLVAPRAGAWIETFAVIGPAGPVIVAPRAGAWIETDRHSRPRWLHKVAPRAGAWIETGINASSYSGTLSHPVRVRGLKPYTF